MLIWMKTSRGQRDVGITFVRGLQESFLNGRDELLRNVHANRLVFKLKLGQFFTRHWLKLTNDSTKLTSTSTLLLVQVVKAVAIIPTIISLYITSQLHHYYIKTNSPDWHGNGLSEGHFRLARGTGAVVLSPQSLQDEK